MTEVLVIGAGITGSACAWRLAEAGFSVTVVHEAPIGGEATGAGMGHLTVHEGEAGVWELALAGRSLWERWAEELEPDIEYHRIGTLWLIPDEQAFILARRLQERFRDCGFRTELLDPVELGRREPHLRPYWLGALYVPDDATIYAPRAAWRLLERARARRARLIRARVVALEPDGVRLAGGVCLKADYTVIAAGVQAVELLPDLPVRPRRGHLLVSERRPGLVRHALVSMSYSATVESRQQASWAFNVHPRPNGQLLIGSCREWDVWDRRPDPKWGAQLLQEACRYIPELATTNVLRSWTGLRAASRDGRPLIGPHPQEPCWIVATAQEGLGITMAPAVAELVWAYISAKEPPLDPSPYRLEGRLCPNPSQSASTAAL